MDRMQLLIHSQTSTVQPLRFQNRRVIHITLYWIWDYSSMLGLKFIHVSKYDLLVILLHCVGQSFVNFFSSKCIIYIYYPQILFSDHYMQIPKLFDYIWCSDWNKLTNRCNKCLILWFCNPASPLQWRHNGHDGVWNQQHRDCLLKRLFRCRSKRTSKLRVTGLCAGNSPVTAGAFPAQRASNVEIFPSGDVIMQYINSDTVVWYINRILLSHFHFYTIFHKVRERKW